MKFDLITEFQGTHLLIPFTEISELNPGLSEFAKSVPDLKTGQHYSIYDPKESSQLHFLALGSQEDAGGFEKIRTYLLKNTFLIKDELTVDLRHLPPDYLFEMVLGMGLSGYKPGKLKTEPEDTDLKNLLVHVLISPESDRQYLEASMDTAIKTSDAMVQAMDLVDTPSNIKTPKYISKWAKDSLKQPALRVEVLDTASLEKESLHALLAVGQGSENPPELLCIEYKPEVEATYQLGLVGKGITFDTGGVSLKKPANMHYMKSDMGGAAAILGAMKLIAGLGLNLNVVAVIPLAENTIDARSIKPGDVISSFSGKTIEVIDTDAEGRLILADGLAFIHQKYQPETVIDLATLTGSAVAALGTHAAAIFTNNHELYQLIENSGQAVRERVWRMPLWSDYEEDLYSDLADIRNFSGKPIAGAITAAKFLEFFIKEHPRWAHLDIAGVAFGNTEYAKMKSATGFGVRLIAHFAQQISKSN